MIFRFITLLSLMSFFAFPSWANFGDSNKSFSSPYEGTQSSALILDLDNEEPILRSSDAFVFQAVQNGNLLEVSWLIKPGHYLYKSKFMITGENVKFSQPIYPSGIDHKDEFFGSDIIYKDSMYLDIPLIDIEKKAIISITYQGCADGKFCYQPTTVTTKLTPSSTLSDSPSQYSEKNTILDSQDHKEIAKSLGKQKYALFLMFLFGIGLAFTPCVFPMYPILTGVVLGRSDITRKKAGILSFVYVQGMALTYTALGLVVASAGIEFQTALQSPSVLIGISLVFVVLSLSMFGLFNIQFPSNILTKLNMFSGKQRSGHFVGVFIMGAVSGLVCSPCTTAPLSGALLFVAQSGDLLIGAIALYLLGIGMGIPLIAVAIFGQSILPKSGEWMNRIKTLFGFILLAAPVFLLERLLPEQWSIALWSLLIVSISIWVLWVWKSSPRASVALSALSIGACLAIFGAGCVTGYYVLESQQSNSNKLEFIRINSKQDLEQQLAQAKEMNQPVMIDYYADWCVACKEFEKYTFSDQSVQSDLERFVILQIDATQNSQSISSILASQSVFGLPTIDFWLPNGEKAESARVTGFMRATEFKKRIGSVN